MTGLLLTPIGTSPAWANTGEAGSSFLIEAPGHRLLIDCGSGAIARYLELRGSDAVVDTVLITHVHADHVLDLVPLTYGIRYGNLASWRPRLLLPPGGHDRLRRLVSAWDGPADFFEQVFDVSEFEPAVTVEVDELTISMCAVRHFIEAFAVRVEGAGGLFGYTSDCGPGEDVVEAMRGVDLMLAEATLPVIHHEHDDSRGHLSAEEAGAIAVAAHAGQLLLTHVPEQLHAEAVGRAAARYPGPIELAVSGRTLAVRPQADPDS